MDLFVMAKASDAGTLIGILDQNGKEIANGDRINVQHVNYMGTPKEEMVEEFTAEVFYHNSSAAFLYAKEGVFFEGEDNSYYFNHRSSRFEILEDGK
jgi:hypothetical protein